MPQIVRLTLVESIKPGDPPKIADGTILNPEPYSAANVEFDDGTNVQVERPLTRAKLQAAWSAAHPIETVDSVTTGDVI